MDIVLRCIGKDCNGVSYNTIAVIFAYNMHFGSKLNKI